jgi:hypothetical protein
MSTKSTDLMPVTILDANAFVRPDGRAAIRIQTKEFGPLAFEADDKTINRLRQTLQNAEILLKKGTR